MTRIAVNGAAGRMGQRIMALALERLDSFKIVHALEHAAPILGRDIGEVLGGQRKTGVVFEESLPYAKKEKKLSCNALIDFTGPDGADWALTAALTSKCGLVLGSTGLSEDFLKAVKNASETIPIVQSYNMSVGVNVVLGLLGEAARKLPEDFTISIKEAHHIHKKDAPSGTALMLANAVADAKKWNIAELVKSWRAGKFNSKEDKIGMNVIREGEIVGDHTVHFEGPAENIEISHHALSRDTFARGALLAATFVSQKPCGLYSMLDVLAK